MYLLLFETENFFSGLAYRTHVSSERGHRKRILSKTQSRVELKNYATVEILIKQVAVPGPWRTLADERVKCT